MYTYVDCLKKLLGVIFEGFVKHSISFINYHVRHVREKQST